MDNRRWVAGPALFFIYTVISTVTVNVKYSVTVNVKCNLSFWPVQVVEWKKLLRSMSLSKLIKKKTGEALRFKTLEVIVAVNVNFFSFLFTLPSTLKPMPVNAKDNHHWPLFFSIYPVNAKANANCKIKVSCQQTELICSCNDWLDAQCAYFWCRRLGFNSLSTIILFIVR